MYLFSNNTILQNPTYNNIYFIVYKEELCFEIKRYKYWIYFYGVILHV